MLLDNLLRYKKDYKNCLPSHIAIIMDGNGRWAEKKGKLRIFGYKFGFQAVRRTIFYSLIYKVKVLTLFAFSSENWKRPVLEIMVLMELFFYFLYSELKQLNKHNIRLRVVGDISMFNSTLRHQIYYTEQSTKNNDRLILNIAANYGGRWDIVSAIKKIISKVKQGIYSEENISEYTLSKYLSIDSTIPVDLVIRTGGEYRLSNFLIWQIAYSELYFTNVLWPDFDKREFERAIFSFLDRDRRFGTIKSI